MMPRLHIVSDFAAAPEDEPTHPGDFDTPGHVAEERAIHRIICPHHSITWTKVVAVCTVVTIGVTLALRGLFH